MHFAATPQAAQHLFPGMFALQEQVVAQRRAANQQWFLNVGVSAPLPKANAPVLPSTKDIHHSVSERP
jgi:hypothetical protein